MLYIILIIAFFAAIAGFLLVYVPIKESMVHAQEKAERNVSAELEEMFLFIPVDQLVWVKLGFMLTVGTVLFLLLGNAKAPAPLIAAILGGIAGWFGPEFSVKFMRRKRKKMFGEQLVDGLVLLSNGLRAGFTLQQAVEMLVEETKPPMSQEFALFLREVKVGVEMDQAMLNIVERTKDEDLSLAVTAMMITRQLGGNLSEIFDRIVSMTRERKILEGKVESLTAQGRLQAAIVALMPYALCLVITKVNPEMMSLLWTTLPGFGALALIVILDTAGYFWVLKLSKVEY